MHIERTKEEIYHCAFNPQSTLLATSNVVEHVIWYDTKMWRALKTHRNPAEVNGMAWGIDGGMMAIADSNGALSLFDGQI